eukprot:321079-Chlamydomonas_euryale.AAC.1
MLLDERERLDRPDAADVTRVVTAKQDAQVDKLIHAHAEPRQRLSQVELRRLSRARRRRRQVADEAGRAKREAVHVLGCDCIHQAGLVGGWRGMADQQVRDWGEQHKRVTLPANTGG